MTDCPHCSYNSAQDRARSHQTSVEQLAEVCAVEQGRDYCHICCAVSTD